MKKRSGSFLGTLKNLLIPEDRNEQVQVTNNVILDELIDCFDGSCRTESVGTSLMFNMHFLVILHPDVYEQRLPSLPIVVKESVKIFYKKLHSYRKNYEDIAAVSSLWQFRFGPASDFNGEKITPNNIKVIGMLTGSRSAGFDDDSPASARVTMKSKATNVFDKMDLNLEVLKHIHFAGNGSFTVRFSNDLSLAIAGSMGKQTRNMENGFARIEYFMGDKNKGGVYIMKDTEMVIARKEPENQGYSNYLLIESSYVSNPHARIRLNEHTGKYQIASFSANETRVNEVVVTRSNAESPKWMNLEPKSQVLLNGIVTLEFKQQS
ncbi:MAG: hypothetical protein ABIN89_18700 [Chitinophagaceae bacterium]